jgi:uncharacterized protein DUF4145
MMPYIPPKHNSSGFNCPLCNFYSHQTWYKVSSYPFNDVQNPSGYIPKIDLSLCAQCKEFLLWYDAKIIFPLVNGAPPPHPDMPKDVKEIYEEAKSIVSKSSRAAAALLRTAIELLIDNVIGENKKSLNENIGKLVSQNKIQISIQQSLDYLRIIGDHYLHPGVIQMEDIEENDYEHTISLFELVNLITEELITRPKKSDELFSRIPKRQKDQIEKRDKKNKTDIQ